MNDRARNNGRLAIYGMAGFYLLYMAYNIFKGLGTSSGNEKILMIVFMILFVIIGGGMIAFSLVQMYKIRKADMERAQYEEDEEDDEDDEDVEDEVNDEASEIESSLESDEKDDITE